MTQFQQKNYMDTCVSSRHSRKCVTLLKFMTELNIFKESALGRFFHRVAMSVYVFIYLSPFHVLDFEAYFLPTLWIWISNKFWDSESLGKNAGKKWSQNWPFVLGNGLKSPREKKFFVVADFALQNMVETTLPDGLETSGRRVYR